MSESPTGGAPYLLALRTDVKIEIPPAPPAGDAATSSQSCPRLVDPKTKHALPLDEAWHEAAIGLADGARSADEIVDALMGLGKGAPDDPVEVMHFLKTLCYLRFTQDTDPAALERIAAAVADPLGHLESASWHTLPGARFDCRMSGACCRTLALGPLRPKDLEKLSGLPDLEERFPLAKVLGRTRSHRDGDRVEHYLPQRPDGRCAYLQDDKLCGIHAHYGPDKKPAMCHLFPTGAIATVYGVHVFDRAECEAYGTTAFAGETFGERARRHLPLLRETIERIGVVHPRVNLDGYLQLDYGYFAPFEQHLISCTAVPGGTIADVLLAWREATFHLLVTLSGADLGAAPPDALVGSVAGVPAAARFDGHMSPPDRPQGLEALAAFLGEQQRQQTRLLEDTPAPERRAPALEDVRLAQALCRLEARGAAPEVLREEDPGSRILRRVARLELDLTDPHTDERLRRLLRELIFSKTYIGDGTWTNALSTIAAMVCTMLVGARAGAARDGRTEVTDHDLDQAQFRTLHLFRMPRLRAAPASLAHARAVIENLVLPLTSPDWPPAEE